MLPLRVLTNEEYEIVSRAQHQVSSDLEYEEWELARNNFVKWLTRYGKEDRLQKRRGDFLVDDDWFHVRALSVCFVTKKLFSLVVFEEIKKYLKDEIHQYAVSIVGDFPRNPILFKILITSNESYFTYGIGGLQQYEKMALTDPDVREWLDVLRRIVGNPQP